MININISDKKKWSEIEVFHLAYCHKLVKAKLENVKVVNIRNIKSFIKDLYEKGSQERVIEDLSDINEEEYSKIFAFGITHIKEYLSDANIERIALATIDKFDDIKSDIIVNLVERQSVIPSYIYEKFIYNTLSEVFSYEHFQDCGYLVSVEICGDKYKDIRWNRNVLLSRIDVRVCPYCNRQYITSYCEEGEDRKSTADADHYLSQSQYPWLKLSLYNLIPSCAVCNRTFKGNKVKMDGTNTLYPYSDEDISKQLKFKINFPIDGDGKPCSKAFYNPKRPDINICVAANTEEAEQSKKIFKLENVYKAHKIEAFELLEKIIHYNQKMRKELIERSHGLLNETTIRTMLFDFDQEDLGKKPLSKLKNDIYNKYS